MGCAFASFSKYTIYTHFPFSSSSAKTVPFIVGVHFDNDEVTVGAGVENTNEQAVTATTAPGGIIGFHLLYTLQC